MPTTRPFKALFSLAAILMAGLLLTACGGGGDGASPASAVGAAVPTNPTTPPANPAPPPANPTSGTASLSWIAPTENTDGTPLTNLAGYHIYYGTSAGAWTSTVTILDAAETSYVVDGLAPGKYYFAVVAFNTDGEDSPQSNVGSKTI